MPIEIEAKWLEIDPEKFRAVLTSVGAVLAQPERLMRRKNYDEPTPFAVYDHGWIRVRDEGHQVTLTYKKNEGPFSHRHDGYNDHHRQL